MQGLIPKSVKCEIFRWDTPSGKAEWLWNAGQSSGLHWAMGRAGGTDFCLALVIVPSSARPKTGGKESTSVLENLAFGSFQQDSSMCLLFGCLGITE